MDCVSIVKMASKEGVNGANVVLPTLLTHIDGILTDYLDSKGVPWKSLYDDRIDTKTKRITRIGRKTQFKKISPQVLPEPFNDLAISIFLDILFQKSIPGQPLESKFGFSRHKIIHGENTNYGRKDYLVRAFMVWIC
jgi:hypothetical protein